MINMDINDNSNIFGYGGMHLNCAGICYIDDVIAKNPTICFIDFFSTSYNLCNNDTIDYVDTIVYKFSSIGCKLIFLFLPRQDHNERILFYAFCKKHLNKNSLTYFDLCENIQYSPEIIRDCVHTTETGSKLYANYILEKYNALYTIIIPLFPRKTQYCDIQKTDINKEFNKYVNFSGNCKLVGMEVIIGPYTGILDFVISNKESTKSFSLNVWDQWCYYERASMIRLNKLFELDNMTIHISQKTFDTSSCKNTNFDVSKKLIIKKIFFIGENLSVINNE
jgi:hypothetical protein